LSPLLSLARREVIVYQVGVDALINRSSGVGEVREPGSQMALAGDAGSR
jgi:hypothetical protein